MQNEDLTETESRPKRRRWRTCCCGCIVGLPVLGLVALLALGWAIQGQPLPEVQPNPELASQFETKLRTIRRHTDPMRALSGDLLPTTELTQEELNAYALERKGRLAAPLDRALETVSLDLNDGQFVIRARLNLDELAESALPALPVPSEYGVRLDVYGSLNWKNGQGVLEIQSAKLGSISLPVDSVLWLLQELFPQAQNWVEAAKGFPLPFGTKDLKVEEDKIVLEGS